MAYCPKCGALLEENASNCKCGWVKPVIMVKCKGCGEEIPNDTIFCPKCGVRQNSSTDKEENENRILANKASMSDDVSSMVSDAHSVVKFGKKVGKATIKEVTEKKEGASSKSRVIAALLAFFFGVIGVHSFYLGKKGQGVFHILLLLIGLGVGFATEGELYVITILLEVINECWAFIESILLLLGAGKDGQRLPVKNWT